MKTILKLSMSLVLIFTINSAKASYIFRDISGIENLEWLELTSTDFMSRYEVESELGDGGLFEGWRYASRLEVETLYDGLWGGVVDNTSPSNYQGARRFFDVFGDSSGYSSLNNSGYDNNGYSFWNAHFGNVGDCASDSSLTCRAFVGIYDVNYGAAFNSGYFGDSVGLSTGVDSINDQSAWQSSLSAEGVGSHLVRISAVPIPAALWLFGSGLIGLIGLARYKQA